MTVNLTFAGKHGSDVDLLRYAYDFEQRTKRRIEPPVTPALESQHVAANKCDRAGNAPSLEVHTAERVSEDEVRLTGSVNATEVKLEIRIDGKAVPTSQIEVKQGAWSLRAHFAPFVPAKAIYGGYGEVVGNVVVVVLAKSAGQVAGKLILISQTGNIQK